MTRLFISGIRELCTPRGDRAQGSQPHVETMAQAAIVIEDETIVAVGPESELSHYRQGSSLIDMQGRTAIPCFVDPHTHLVFGGDRSAEFNQRLHGATYTDIAAAGGGIKCTVRETRSASYESLYRKAKKVLNQMLLGGVGTVECKSGYGLDRNTELKQLSVMHGLDQDHAADLVITFMGAHEVPPEYEGRADDYVDFLNREMLPAVADLGYVEYVDIFCEKNVFELQTTEKHMTQALHHGFKLRMHADELYPLRGAGLAARLGAVSADHLIHSHPDDMKAMAQAGTMATLLPGTSFFLRSTYADARGFMDAGCAIALSTDFNPGSSHTDSQALMMALACMNMGLTFEQAFVATTLNAAAALNRADRIGSLEPGKQADIAFLDAPNALYLVYNWGRNHVTDVIKRGRFAVRDGSLVQNPPG